MHRPAFAMVTEQEVEAIGRTLVDTAQPLPTRFRALFTLRNLGGRAAVEWISRAFEDGSALLKHELAFCLGQMQDEAAIPVLIRVLEDTAQEPMVRHEAGTAALGAGEGTGWQVGLGGASPIVQSSSWGPDPAWVSNPESHNISSPPLAGPDRTGWLSPAVPAGQASPVMFVLFEIGQSDVCPHLPPMGSVRPVSVLYSEAWYCQRTQQGS